MYQTSAAARLLSRCSEARNYITNRAGVMHLSHPVALRDFFAQIGQPNIGPAALNQFLPSVLT